MSYYDGISFDEENKIRTLLLGKTVTKVDEDRLLLSDGTILRIHPNSGCGGCTAGNYWLNELNDSPVNAIMNIEFDRDGDEDYDPWSDGGDQRYRIFVYAANEKIKLLEVEGSDGNGYYGTGYWIEIVK